ncbi:tripartite tricarboxylate transporter substrate-binding protein [Roseomonas sp. NAR14]|uniref:Tripartite tricarboxylate transporter substrate-binding protein n=1 Tax=Roseomonas acroporae TaxID=2937791 RepID=A0A9X1YAV4_9PROT|nr:tripartite tricarboxylate transporter substrate-binding protein [Roseomonas acroporae]MCK8787354.1 tripartite tricarboxylate transporter substrate-binding protein [Roseomonas acroporae]
MLGNEAPKKRKHLVTKIGRRAVLGLTAAAIANVARAQPLDRVARLLVGFPPGGAADIVARIYAERLRGSYAQQVVVENRPGAAARLVLDAGKAAAPDGATLVFTPESMLTIYPHIYPRTLRYDGTKDFVPGGATSSFGFAFVVAPDHPAQDLAGFARWAQTQRDVSYASPAAGSMPHFVAEQMSRKLDLRLMHVAYRGTGLALPDLSTGRLGAIISVIGDMAEQSRGGHVRVLAVSTPKRVASLPDVPTFAELGHPDLTAEELYTILLPAGTPQPIVERLESSIAAASANPELRAALAKMEQVPVLLGSQGMIERIRAERDRWGPIVRATGYTAEE